MLMGVVGAALTACAQSEAGTAADASDQLSAAAQSLHQTILSVRAREPAATGPPAIQAVLGRSGLGSGQGSTGPNGETVLVLPVTARAIHGGGLSYTDVSLGGCLRVTATVGRADGGVGERGRVTTEPVPCPPGVNLEVDGHQAKEAGTGIGVMQDDVPEAPYERRPCLSGSPDNCVGG